ASDPTIERIITPRITLTTAEFLANETWEARYLLLKRKCLEGVGTLGIYIPIWQRSMTLLGEIKGERLHHTNSIFDSPKRWYYPILPVRVLCLYITLQTLDLTSSITDTEGHMNIDRQLRNRQIYPPIYVFPSLSRLMKSVGDQLTDPLLLVLAAKTIIDLFLFLFHQLYAI
ncbi:hypothetical protein RJ639_017711, partial [Escallonia herrerae]